MTTPDVFLQQCGDDNYDEFVLALFDSSEDETEAQIDGPRNGRRPEVARNRKDGLKRLKADYFPPNAIYGDILFRGRFRLAKTIFLKYCKSNHITR